MQSPARNPASESTSAAIRASTVCQNLYEIVCRHKGVTHDPTGALMPDVEGERLTLNLYQEIIAQHPDWESDAIDQELANQIFTPKRRSRVEGAYFVAKRGVEHFIDRQPSTILSAHQKRQLHKKVHKVVLELPPANLYSDEPDLLTKTGAFYERQIDGSTRIRIGGAYIFSGDSWFNLVSTLAHELAHSIDPCEMRLESFGLPAYERLGACFIKTGVVATRTNRLECGEDDQLSEAFADWVAAQVVGDELKRFSTEFDAKQLLSSLVNSVRDLCEQDGSLEEVDTSNHPSPHVRIAAIFGRNPIIQELMGCPAASPIEPAYCEFTPP